MLLPNKKLSLEEQLKDKSCKYVSRRQAYIYQSFICHSNVQ